MLHLFERDLIAQLIHDHVELIEVLMRHLQPDLIESVLLPALLQNLLEMLIVNDLFEL